VVFKTTAIDHSAIPPAFESARRTAILPRPARANPSRCPNDAGKKISHDRARVTSGSKTCGDFDTPGALSHTRSHDTVAEHGCMTQHPRAKWRVLWNARKRSRDELQVNSQAEPLR
jgi:hypothetical protein